jgi:exopolyphosphatase/guanosine-5'-triphosphate,3'-diphosphate pyrophosphatase
MRTPPRAALDVGSNTCRLLVARPAGKGVQPLIARGAFVRLGQGIDETGHLHPERIDAALAALSSLMDEAMSAAASRIHAIATSAVRDAANGEAFVNVVRRQTGIDLEILSAYQEGELTYLGATCALSLPGETIVVDLGGRSTEIVAADPAGVRWVHSLPLGSGRLMDAFVQRDRPRRAELRNLADHVDDALELAPRLRAHTVVLTGGTARQITRVLGLGALGRHGSEVQTRLDPGRIDDAAARVSNLRVDRISRTFGVRPERAAVLPAGLWALRQIVRHYRPKVVIVTRSGLREGVLVESFRRDGELLAA